LVSAQFFHLFPEVADFLPESADFLDQLIQGLRSCWELTGSGRTAD